MERIGLDEVSLEIELPKQLLEHSSFVVLADRVASLSDSDTQSSGAKLHLRNLDAVGRPQGEPQLLVGSIEPRRALPSQTT